MHTALSAPAVDVSNMRRYVPAAGILTFFRHGTRNVLDAVKASSVSSPSFTVNASPA